MQVLSPPQPTRVATARQVTLRDADLERFWSLVEKIDGGCWRWRGNIHKATGYGRFSYENRTVYAYRLAYELLHGPIPPGHEPDHTCRNRACVNAEEHIEAVPKAVNILRGESPPAKNARKTACRFGHPLTVGSNGKRYCPECHRVARRRRYAAGWRAPGRKTVR